METTSNNPIIITKQDHETLLTYLKKNPMELKYDHVQAEQLLEELKTAEIVNKSDIPGDAVRLGSTVILRNTIARQNYTYTLVLPTEMDNRNEKISVVSPLGAALMGARVGETITLPLARGKRFFTIVQVNNPVE